MPEFDNKELLGKKTIPTPVEQPKIGVDLEDKMINKIIEDSMDGIVTSSTDLSDIESLVPTAQTREQIYALIDLMAMDDRIKAILDTYTEDTIETNEVGQVVWCESSDENVLKYVTYLLNSFRIEDNIEEWVRSFIKYGDIYLRLFRESDYEEDDVFTSSKEQTKNFNKTLNEAYNLEDEEEDEEESNEDKNNLNESVYANVHDKNDHYVHYAEMVANPGEMFDLTKFGSTRGFIKVPVIIQNTYDYQDNMVNPYISYRLKNKDIEVFGATDFVHGTLNSNVTRNPEEVQIFKDDESYDENKGAQLFKVNRGQSMLYSQFRIWREISLLENSVLLNRLTRSSLVRILNVEVGDMPKSQAQNVLSRIKQNIEQKSAIKVGTSLSEYTNPGPIDNAIYVPTHNGQGAITASNLGGDFDPKQLTDLDYFLNKLYGSFRVPKQFFNLTDDGAGFNGGASLTIISSRYGKAIKSIQKATCQFITTLVNIMLWDKGLSNYINKFTIRMQAPITQEELDRRDNMRNKMGVNQDVMNLVGDLIEDDVIKLKMVKALLASSINNPEVIDLIQEQIDIKEQEKEDEDNDKDKDKDKTNIDMKSSSREESPMDEFEKEIGFTNEEPSEEETIEEPETELSGETIGGESSYLPTPEEVGLDATVNQ